MSPVSQLLLRNQPDIHPGTGLCWVNPGADEAWLSLKAHADSLSLWCQDYRDWVYLDKAGATAVFADFPSTGFNGTSHFILSLPRSKQRLDMLLGFIHSVMPRDSKLWLAGENRAGIRSTNKSLEKWFKTVQQIEGGIVKSIIQHEKNGKSAPKIFSDTCRINWHTPLNSIYNLIRGFAFQEFLKVEQGGLEQKKEICAEIFSKIEKLQWLIDFNLRK